MSNTKNINSIQPKVGWVPFTNNIQTASSRMRSYLPCEYLKSKGFACEIYQAEHKNQYDIVVFQKIYSESAVALAMNLKSQNVKIIFDLCDNHFYVPNKTVQTKQKSERLKQMLALADVVSVSNLEIAKLISDKTTWLIDDVIEIPRLNLIKKWWHQKWIGQKNTLKIVWYGSSGHKEPASGLIDLPLALPFLETLHKQHQIELTVISNNRDKFNQYVSTTNFPTKYVAWKEKTFPYIFKQQDICIIPINLNPFTICKTSNRLVTSLMLGVPVVADEIPSYAEFNEYCYLNDWSHGLFEYANSAVLRQQDVRRAREYIGNRYSIEVVTQQWKSLFDFLRT